MTRRAGGVTPGKYEKLTEACPKMTRRFKRESIPELAAWLRLHYVRIMRQKLHVDQAAQKGGGEEIREAGKRLAVRMVVIEDMVRQLFDKWDDYLWWEVAAETEALLGPVPVKPVHTPSIPGAETPPARKQRVNRGHSPSRAARPHHPAGTGEDRAVGDSV